MFHDDYVKLAVFSRQPRFLLVASPKNNNPRQHENNGKKILITFNIAGAPGSILEFNEIWQSKRKTQIYEGAPTIAFFIKKIIIIMRT